MPKKFHKSLILVILDAIGLAWKVYFYRFSSLSLIIDL